MSEKCTLVNIADRASWQENPSLAAVRTVMCETFEDIMDRRSYWALGIAEKARVMASTGWTIEQISQEKRSFWSKTSHYDRYAISLGLKEEETFEQYLTQLYVRSYYLCIYAAMKSISIVHALFPNMFETAILESKTALRFFGENHQIARLFDGENYFAFSVANVFNPSGSLSHTQKLPYDRVRTIFVATTPRNLLQGIRKYEGGRQWKLTRTSAEQAERFVSIFLEGNGID